MLEFMKDEFERSRQHELKLFQMLSNSINNNESQPSPVQGTCQPGPSQAAMNVAYQPSMVPQPNIWTSGYHFNQGLNSQSFAISSHVSQSMPTSSTFLSQLTEPAEENLNDCFLSGKHYHTLRGIWNTITISVHM